MLYQHLNVRRKRSVSRNALSAALKYTLALVVASFLVAACKKKEEARGIHPVVLISLLNPVTPNVISPCTDSGAAARYAAFAQINSWYGPVESADGACWRAGSSSLTVDRSIEKVLDAVQNGNTRVVLIGGGSGPFRVQVSTDGGSTYSAPASFVPSITPADGTITYVGGMYYIMVKDGSSKEVLHSADGSNWTAAAMAGLQTNGSRFFAYNNGSANVLVIFGGRSCSAGGYIMQTSLDNGANWSAPNPCLWGDNAMSLSYAAYGASKLILAGTVTVSSSNFRNELVTSSDDGSTFSTGFPTEIANGIVNIAYAGGLFYLSSWISNQSPNMYTSTDGAGWTPLELPKSQTFTLKAGLLYGLISYVVYDGTTQRDLRITSSLLDTVSAANPGTEISPTPELHGIVRLP